MIRGKNTWVIFLHFWLALTLLYYVPQIQFHPSELPIHYFNTSITRSNFLFFQTFCIKAVHSLFVKPSVHHGSFETVSATVPATLPPRLRMPALCTNSKVHSTSRIFEEIKNISYCPTTMQVASLPYTYAVLWKIMPLMGFSHCCFSRKYCLSWPTISSSALKKKSYLCSKSGTFLPPRGTRDFYPDEMRRRHWLFSEWKNVSETFGFEPYDAPLVENLSLFKNRSPTLVEQLYTFEDKRGRALALRAEMTPSLLRLLNRKGAAVALPLKWYSLPQCWRYERQAKDRRREHYQWNLDIIGLKEVEAEAELLAALTFFFKKIHLSERDLEIRLNSRKLLEKLFHKCKIPSTFWPSLFLLLDKWEKISESARLSLLYSTGLEQSQVMPLLAFLNFSHSLESLTEIFGDTPEVLLPLQQLMEYANLYGYKEWIKFHPFTVRGLSYYTELVFEIFDRLATHRAVCGGGRYNTLLTASNGNFTPAVGVGMGDIVIMEILKEREKFPFSSAHHLHSSADFTLWAAHPPCYSAGLSLATQLRLRGWRVWMSPRGGRTSLQAKSIFRRAYRHGCAAVLLLTEAYLQNPKKIQIRRLWDGYQMACTEDALPHLLSHLSLSRP